ncbi:MAG: hypothetical protein EPN31_07565 [Castellaniella sp.]|uniref:hypothetical protein n=1 Tax=Castellaniella sp. TaxID=1955812 RepID=UPI0012243C1A|nr:hypothetical protein [Castellaniella sp.]TAN28858.1 MAG: hypothetical protein EPN31_07565 [Castellaniella sp.]
MTVENPFGDSPSSQQPKTRPYLVLISAVKDNLALAQQIVKNIQTEVDERAAPLWIDSKGIGLLVNTELVAWEIRKEALSLNIKTSPQDVKGFLVLEIGPDWAAPKDATTAHWLASHVGDPRPVPYQRDRSH